MSSTRTKPATPAQARADLDAATAAITAALDEDNRAADAPAPIATEDGELRADVAAVLAKLKTVRAEAKALSDEDVELLAEVRAAVREGRLKSGDYTHGGRKVLTLSWPASFDADTATAAVGPALLPVITKRVPAADLVEKAHADGVLTDEQYAAITREVVDRTLAKENLPPKLYERCLVPAANPTIKPVA